MCYNPDNRISAETALVHPWFAKDPIPCKPKNVRKFNTEYHDTLISDLKYRKELKKAQEQAKHKKNIKNSESPIKNIREINTFEQKKTKSVNRLCMLINKKQDFPKKSENFVSSKTRNEKKNIGD